MWTKDIRSQTNLQVGQISKSLKVLMTRKLIKEVKVSEILICFVVDIH